MKAKQKSLKVILMALVMIFSLFGVMPSVEIESSASGVDNIVARADYLYNIT